jgi:hypothetical protein
MGIRGTVRRSVDGRLVHTNVRPPAWPRRCGALTDEHRWTSNH